MKVVCKSSSAFLKKGEVYDVEIIDGDMFCIKKDCSNFPCSCWYHRMNFETNQEIRERRLKELGI